MLKSRSLQMRFVPTNTSESTVTETLESTANKLITKINRKAVVSTVAGAVATYAAVVTINTISNIAENRFTK